MFHTGRGARCSPSPPVRQGHLRPAHLASGARTLNLGALDPTRDFLFVEDTAAAFVAVGTAPAAAVASEVLNAGTGSDIAIGDLAATLCRLMGVDADIVEDAARLRPKDSEVRRLVCDAGRLTERTGWVPTGSSRPAAGPSPPGSAPTCGRWSRASARTSWPRSPAKTRSFGTVRMRKKKPVTTATITKVMPTMRSKLAVMELTPMAAATEDGDLPGSTATPTRLSGTSGALGLAAATVRRKVPMVVYAVGAALNLDSSV
ncbi:MAG TPA: GDP-mannose 4,6-dehydratase [Acidimicrobiales bacterium]|nr:GDP-mannose 4,6-dehydratase [Acidimicrobiales bacterium]